MKIILIASLLLSGCSLKSQQITFAGLQTADLVSTEYAESRGAVEANPIFRGGLAKRIVLKSVSTASVIYLSHTLAKAGRKKLARGLLYAVNGLLTVVVINNLAIAKGSR